MCPVTRQKTVFFLVSKKEGLEKGLGLYRMCRNETKDRIVGMCF